VRSHESKVKSIEKEKVFHKFLYLPTWLRKLLKLVMAKVRFGLIKAPPARAGPLNYL